MVQADQWENMEYFQDTDEGSSASAGRGLKQIDRLDAVVTNRH